MADKKIAVYICSDCGIGEALNIEALQTVASKEYKIEIVKTAPFLCSEEGAAIINDDINNEGVNKIVIAACSPRVHTDIFDYDTLKYVTERVNLREQIVWTQMAGETIEAEVSPAAEAASAVNENTQEMAEDHLRMGIVRAQKSEPPVPFIEEINRTILVIGGGKAGLTSALESAKAGYDVVLL